MSSQAAAAAARAEAAALAARAEAELVAERMGAELLAARAAGVPWKALMRRTGLGRTRLWQLWRAAKDVHSGASEHQNAGQGPGPARRLLFAA